MHKSNRSSSSIRQQSDRAHLKSAPVKKISNECTVQTRTKGIRTTKRIPAKTRIDSEIKLHLPVLVPSVPTRHQCCLLRSMSSVICYACRLVRSGDCFQETPGGLSSLPFSSFQTLHIIRQGECYKLKLMLILLLLDKHNTIVTPCDQIKQIKHLPKANSSRDGGAKPRVCEPKQTAGLPKVFTVTRLLICSYILISLCKAEV